MMAFSLCFFHSGLEHQEHNSENKWYTLATNLYEHTKTTGSGHAEIVMQGSYWMT